MRDYGKLHCVFWTSPSIRSLSDDAKMMAAYLLTSPHGTLTGCFRLPDGYICEDMNWGSERVSKGFAELVGKGFATRCETTKWVHIVKFLEWNPLENPNQVKAAVKALADIPDQFPAKQALARLLGNSDEAERLAKLEPLPNPFATLSKPVTVTVAVDVTETVSVARAVLVPTVKPVAPTNEVWAGYSKAYFNRYGTEPVRNAKANGILANFLKRIPADEAPHIAAFYVANNSQFYVKKMHPVDLLLDDAEKLRTEWVTRRQVTETAARQVDKTQANGDVWQKLIDKQEAANANA